MVPSCKAVKDYNLVKIIGNRYMYLTLDCLPISTDAGRKWTTRNVMAVFT